MSTTPDLTTLPRASLRLLLACWRNAAGPTAYAEPYTTLWTRLRTEPGWVPTRADAPLQDVQDWLAGEEEQAFRAWLETRMREEGQ